MAEGEARLEIRRLEDEDEIEQFCCGDKELDDFLKDDAHRLHTQDVTRVYVAAIGRRVCGYVAILADVIELKTPEVKKLKLKHDDPKHLPALKVGRLGVDKDFRAEYPGTGTALMGLAFRYGLIVARTAGCRLLTVDAYLESVAFYEKLGFIRNKIQEIPRTPPPRNILSCTARGCVWHFKAEPLTESPESGDSPPESRTMKPTISLRLDLKVDPKPAWAQEEDEGP